MLFYDFDDESVGMGRGCCFDEIDSIVDFCKCRVVINSGICIREIVVNGIDEIDNVEMFEWLKFLGGKFVIGSEFVEQ